MAPRLCGLETEYAFSMIDTAGRRVPLERAIDSFVTVARAQLRHLPGHNPFDLWLPNGARLYIDCGKPEMNTPECTDVWEVCRYYLAGGRILRSLAEQLLRERRSLRDVWLSAVNVSYTGNGTTWAAHESYSHRANLEALPRQLIPHFVSRQVFAGAGGFDPRSPGIVFLLSPRVAFLEQTVSPESTRCRGIFHTKNEPLNSAAYHRLHVLAGESLCSERGLWLKLASTMLILALAEADKQPGAEVQLTNPLEAMYAYATDPALTAAAPSASGRRLTALDIQRHYLQLAERYQDADFMPPWTPQACALWRQMLDWLASGWEAVQTRLDWAIKLALYRQRATRRGLSWESLDRWNQILGRLQAELPPVENGHPRQLTAELVRGDGPLAKAVQRVSPAIRRLGLEAAALPEVLALRQELFEVDTRYGQLTGTGVFAALDAAGVLDHHVPGVENVEQAMTQPPRAGRARLRGEYIRDCSGSPEHFVCDWTGIWEPRQRRFLDLSDPFVENAQWREQPRDDSPPPFRTSPRRMVQDRVMSLYDTGNYETAAHWLGMARRLTVGPPGEDGRELLRISAWLQARRGYCDGAAILDGMLAGRAPDLVTICDYVCIYRFQGLVPAPEIHDWIRRGMGLLASPAPADPATRAAFLGHYGFLLLCENRVEEAFLRLQEACRSDVLHHVPHRARARLLAELAETHRRRGHPGEALTLLAQAERLQEERRYHADRAELTLTRRAKVLAPTDPGSAQRCLSEALAQQQRLQHGMGEARTLLLQARLPRAAAGDLDLARLHGRLLELRNQRPALANCPLLARLLAHWDAWCGEDPIPDEIDYFSRL
jgi:hypothetical protein